MVKRGSYFGAGTVIQAGLGYVADPPTVKKGGQVPPLKLSNGQKKGIARDGVRGRREKAKHLF